MIIHRALLVDPRGTIHKELTGHSVQAIHDKLWDIAFNAVADDPDLAPIEDWTIEFSRPEGRLVP